MANFFRSPMDILQAIDQESLDPLKQKLSGDGGPFRIVRFETAKGALCVVLENTQGEHRSLNGNATKWMNLEALPPRELVFDPSFQF